MKGGKQGSIRFSHFLVATVFLLLLAGICHVWVNFKRTQMGYTLTELKREIARIEEHNRKLKLEIAFLRSPEYLERKAVKELGLRHPLLEQVVFLP